MPSKKVDFVIQRRGHPRTGKETKIFKYVTNAEKTRWSLEAVRRFIQDKEWCKIISSAEGVLIPE